MKALVKTLIGDRYNAAAVAGIVILDLVLVRAGEAVAADVLTPVALLAAAVWLARR